jgi:hypothetical protein
MSGGGGFPSIDKVNEATAAIKPPSREEQPWLYEDDPHGNSRLSSWYTTETARVAREMQPQDPVSLYVNLSQAADKANAAGRLADPEYDIKGKPDTDYTKIEWTPDYIDRLASQRASDYLSDQMQKYSEQQKEFSRADQEYALAQRKQYEAQRLTEAAKGDQGAREAARQARISRLYKGDYKFKAGSSLLTLDNIDTAAGASTLLTA